MPYVTSVEREGATKGVRKGATKGVRKGRARPCAGSSRRGSG